MTTHQDRLLEIEKEINEIRTERCKLWSEEDKIKIKHEELQKRNSSLVTEYFKLKGVNF